MTQGNINHTVLDMETIGHYQPIAGLGRNTIRKLTGKYADLAVGDMVEMHYVTGEGEEAVCHSIERLKVSAIAAAPLDTIAFSEHFDMNHGDWDTPEDLIAFLNDCYPDTSEDALFVAIYFH